MDQPIQPAVLPMSTCHHFVAKAKLALLTAVIKYPMAASPFLFPILSLYQPDHTSKMVDMPSATPSIMPRADAGACSTDERKIGSIAEAISWFQSLKRLASPIPKMFRLSHPRFLFFVWCSLFCLESRILIPQNRNHDKVIIHRHHASRRSHQLKAVQA